MDCFRLIFTVIGFSASFLFWLPNLKRWHKQQITREKLRIVNEALAFAEESAQRYQERHDRLLTQANSFYLSNQDLEEGLVAARTAMDEALEFAVKLRDLQMKILINFPDEANLSLLGTPSPNPRRIGNN